MWALTTDVTQWIRRGIAQNWVERVSGRREISWGSIGILMQSDVMMTRPSENSDRRRVRPLSDRSDTISSAPFSTPTRHKSRHPALMAINPARTACLGLMVDHSAETEAEKCRAVKIAKTRLETRHASSEGMGCQKCNDAAIRAQLTPITKLMNQSEFTQTVCRGENGDGLATGEGMDARVTSGSARTQ